MNGALTSFDAIITPILQAETKGTFALRAEGEAIGFLDLLLELTGSDPSFVEGMEIVLRGGNGEEIVRKVKPEGIVDLDDVKTFIERLRAAAESEGAELEEIRLTLNPQQPSHQPLKAIDAVFPRAGRSHPLRMPGHREGIPLRLAQVYIAEPDVRSGISSFRFLFPSSFKADEVSGGNLIVPEEAGERRGTDVKVGDGGWLGEPVEPGVKGRPTVEVSFGSEGELADVRPMTGWPIEAALTSNAGLKETSEAETPESGGEAALKAKAELRRADLEASSARSESPDLTGSSDLEGANPRWEGKLDKLSDTDRSGGSREIMNPRSSETGEVEADRGPSRALELAQPRWEARFDFRPKELELRKGTSAESIRSTAAPREAAPGELAEPTRLRPLTAIRVDGLEREEMEGTVDSRGDRHFRVESKRAEPIEPSKSRRSGAEDPDIPFNGGTTDIELRMVVETRGASNPVDRSDEPGHVGLERRGELEEGASRGAEEADIRPRLIEVEGIDADRWISKAPSEARSRERKVADFEAEKPEFPEMKVRGGEDRELERPLSSITSPAMEVGIGAAPLGQGDRAEEPRARFAASSDTGRSSIRPPEVGRDRGGQILGPLTGDRSRSPVPVEAEPLEIRDEASMGLTLPISTADDQVSDVRPKGNIAPRPELMKGGNGGDEPAEIELTGEPGDPPTQAEPMIPLDPEDRGEMRRVVETTDPVDDRHPEELRSRAREVIAGVIDRSNRTPRSADPRVSITSWAPLEPPPERSSAPDRLPETPDLTGSNEAPTAPRGELRGRSIGVDRTAGSSADEPIRDIPSQPDQASSERSIAPDALSGSAEVDEKGEVRETVRGETRAVVEGFTREIADETGIGGRGSVADEQGGIKQAEERRGRNAKPLDVNDVGHAVDLRQAMPSEASFRPEPGPGVQGGEDHRRARAIPDAAVDASRGKPHRLNFNRRGGIEIRPEMGGVKGRDRSAQVELRFEEDGFDMRPEPRRPAMEGKGPIEREVVSTDRPHRAEGFRADGVKPAPSRGDVGIPDVGAGWDRRIEVRIRFEGEAVSSLEVKGADEGKVKEIVERLAADGVDVPARVPPQLGGEVRVGDVAEGIADVIVREVSELRSGGDRDLIVVRSVRVRLEPEHLGRVEIRVIKRGERISAIIRAEADRTRRMLHQIIPAIREALAEHGIRPGEIEVRSFESPLSSSWSTAGGGHQGQEFQNGRHWETSPRPYIAAGGAILPQREGEDEAWDYLPESSTLSLRA